MLTSYLVHCAHAGCDWSGSLLPCRNQDSWLQANPTTNIAVFQCPECGHMWQARIEGDDVFPLPESEQVHLV
jgi:hypothetical protein